MTEQSTLDVYTKFRDEILKRQLSNTENYDKAVLSLSSAFLGFSLAFMKDFVQLSHADFVWMLPGSWIFFGIAIFCTIASFMTSQLGLNLQLEYSGKYYLENDQNFLNRENLPAKFTDIFNWVSAVSFVTAVILTISFTSINLKKGKNMSSEKNYSQEGASIPAMMVKGASIPSMQQVPLGAQIPPMQQVSQPVAQSSTPSTTVPINQNNGK